MRARPLRRMRDQARPQTLKHRQQESALSLRVVAEQHVRDVAARRRQDGRGVSGAPPVRPHPLGRRPHLGALGRNHRDEPPVLLRHLGGRSRKGPLVTHPSRQAEVTLGGKILARPQPMQRPDLVRRDEERDDAPASGHEPLDGRALGLGVAVVGEHRHRVPLERLVRDRLIGNVELDERGVKSRARRSDELRELPRGVRRDLAEGRRVEHDHRGLRLSRNRREPKNNRQPCVAGEHARLHVVRRPVRTGSTRAPPGRAPTGPAP